MTPKQREFLGHAWSERVERLLDRLETLSGKEVVFDRDIEALPVIGAAKGRYYVGATPRISLLEGASEIVAAHEFLHGILEYEHYPVHCSSNLRTLLPFITDVAAEVSQCPLHIVIDCRLHELGYDVRAHRLERTQSRAAGLARVRPSIVDPQQELWWCIWAACEIACNATFPTATADFNDPFAVQARDLLPRCRGLADRFIPIVQAMQVDDPRNVQLSVRQMLAAVEAEYGAYPYLTNLQRFSVFSPLFVTREQLAAPAGSSIRFDVAVWLDRNQVKRGTIAVISEKSSGPPGPWQHPRASTPRKSFSSWRT